MVGCCFFFFFFFENMFGLGLLGICLGLKLGFFFFGLFCYNFLFYFFSNSLLQFFFFLDFSSKFFWHKDFEGVPDKA